MSRIDEALRRARSSTQETAAVTRTPEPAPPLDLDLQYKAYAPAPAAQMIAEPELTPELDPAEEPELLERAPMIEPPASEPAPRVSQAAPARPVAAQPVAAQPVAAQPVAAQPVAAQPVGAQPVAPRPAAMPDPPRERKAPEQTWRGRLNEKLILNADAPQAAVEQYRKAAASLHQLQLDRGVKIVMVASAIAEEGKTITASNIALTLSESFRRRVLLIDADLRRPSVHAMFGTPNVTGLSDALQSPQHEKLTIFEVTPQLSVLPAGPPKPDPIGSLISDRMRMIIAEAGAKFDWVVIDTPPVGVLADARLLAEMVHTVVLVIGAGRTPYRAIERAVAAIDRKRIAGVVLNRVVEQPAAYQYYDYYVRPAARG